MKQLLTALALILGFTVSAQQMVLKKGIVIDSLSTNDTIPETYSIYLPSNFATDSVWPLVLVTDMEGRGKRALSMMKDAAEKEGYMLAASNNLSDTLSISNNILVFQRLFNAIVSTFPIQKHRIYSAGFGSGGKFASLLPAFLSGIEGVLSCGASIANIEVLNTKKPFYYISVIGVSDYNYRSVLNMKSILDRMRFDNRLMVFDGGNEWPPERYLSRALTLFTLRAMEEKHIDLDGLYADKIYRSDLSELSSLLAKKEALLAENLIDEMTEIYKPFRSVDSLETSQKVLRKSTIFKNQNKKQKANFLKEQFLEEDYSFYMEEDVMTYNYNNLGWWRYQMESLQKFQDSPDRFTQQMGSRLKGFVEALLADNIDMVSDAAKVDKEALNFLYMLKTIISPEDHEAYFKVISLSSQLDDFGAALFYLEELLKTGYKNKSKLYSIENTALLRITPEYNELIEKYLNDARYSIIPE